MDGHSARATEDSMIKGFDIITQARFEKDGWVGIADILRKVPGKSKLGDWYYAVEDTKLARETKAGTVLQLCLYSELLGDIQGQTPENMYVIKPGVDFPTEKYRFQEFESYYRIVKERFQQVMLKEPEKTYPLPVGKCDTCRWWKACYRKWHVDDHLSLIAGIRSNQTKELDQQGISTLEMYAKETKPFRTKPEQGNEETYQKIHHQAQVQLKGRVEKKMLYDLLPIEPLRGLNRLPEISKGDLYFDIEGDHFYEEGGLEYLFGISYINDEGELDYKSFWAKDRVEEKKMFEEFMGFVLDRWGKFPDMHIYHYAPYEPTAIKRLASRCAIFEQEVDQLLRSGRFVDLFSVIKETLIASVESYSLKEIEKFTDYSRKVDIRLASDARRRMSIALDFNDFSSFSDSDFELIEAYNKDDCLATLALHKWIESICQEQIAKGADLTRLEDSSGEAGESIAEGEAYARALYDSLVGDLPDYPDDWENEEQAKWLLAHQVEFYRREMRSAWWEFFRLRELESNEMMDERKGIAGLSYQLTLPESKRVPIDRYSYPPQEISMDSENEVYEPYGEKIGTIHDYSLANRTVDIKKTGKTAGIHPYALFIKDIVSNNALVPSFHKLIESIIFNGIDGSGPYRAGRDVLLKKPPRLAGNNKLEIKDGETFEYAVLRIVLNLENGILPVQGPPGTGKTHLGGELIAALYKANKRIGVTAVSHKVIRNLLDKAVERGAAKGIEVEIRHKAKSWTGNPAGDPIFLRNKDEAIIALNQGHVVGGTAWLWADDIFEDTLDYLFVDEAGQMSLTHVMTISRAARNIILLGDPQQLEQPKKGAHPEGADISALEHILDGNQTMPEEKGLFLGTTWRLHPSITDFTSTLYYEGRLKSREGLEIQKLEGNTPFSGSGLFYVPVDHFGNQSQSKEEVKVIVKIVNHLMAEKITWIDRDGVSKQLQQENILIIAPYNAQVSALQEALPGFSIGTVDKFQGQEAPVVIYSMTSSSSEDAPRGMSFLYNPNRMNVATSRAKCISILISSPKLFEVECNTIEQMKWANGVCLYREMAIVVEPNNLDK
ncbi:MAG: TM0106 family RecB-like putative nuclease [Deltaproteobacteria bacterium]|nr:TM0106 family RecB-like putative nuclease [Deltaproteobacteria bacterium]